ncbi:hypothetical protein NBRC116602_02960 [Hyphomicrobiales bacterium 4NK60-0047b]
MNYRPDIDGIRAISVISVVIYHAFPNYMPGGFVGVDLFFVISGFLITTIILSEQQKGNFNFINFYSRRIKRIFPALITVLTISFIGGYFLLLPNEFKLLGKHIAGGAGFVSNLVLWNESGYFDVEAVSKPLLHLWSLGIEEQFYIIFPVILWIAASRNYHVFKLIIFLTLLSFLVNIALHKSEPISNFYSPISRFWELLIGSVLAYMLLFEKKSIHQQRSKIDAYIQNSNLKIINFFTTIGIQNLVSAVGLIFIFIALFFASGRRFPGTWALLPTIGAFLVILAGKESWLNKNFLSNSVLVYVGLISFPLYLWHWVLLSYVFIITGNAVSEEGRLLIVALSFFLASITYYYIEKPIRYGTSNGMMTLGLLFSMGVLLTVGLIVYWFDGIPSRVPNSNNLLSIQKQFTWEKSNNADPLCLKKYGGDQYCKISRLAKSPTVALIGDSHANHFFLGLSDYLQKKGENLLHLGVGGCAPFLHVDWGNHPNHGNLRCYERSKKIYDFVLQNQNIKMVILAFQHTEYFRNDIDFIDKMNEIQRNNNLENSYLALKRTIEIFNKVGKKVVLIQDLPNLKYDLKDCLNTRPIEIYKKVCDFKDVFQSHQIKIYNKFIDRLEKETNITIFRTHPYLHDNFVFNKNGLPSYRDGSHLSESGSMYFSDKYDF